MPTQALIVLIANSLDFASDYIVRRLRERGLPYLRLDLDLIHDDLISLDPVRQMLELTTEGRHLLVESAEIASVFYRAPTHLRESSGSRYEPTVLLQRHQWAAFARSLSVFTRATWLNHPHATYAAENKPYQLMVAQKLGFVVPETRIANHLSDDLRLEHEELAVKAVDSFLVRVGAQDSFFYTQPIPVGDLTVDVLQQMPVILQEYLEPKLDIRVTVVGNRLFAAAVQKDGAGIRGDWRLAKNEVRFVAFELPEEIRQQCIRLVAELGLVFGAIDLALASGKFYFLEINPTGEWAWLVDQLGFPIDEVITDALAAK